MEQNICVQVSCASLVLHQVSVGFSQKLPIIFLYAAPTQGHSSMPLTHLVSLSSEKHYLLLRDTILLMNKIIGHKPRMDIWGGGHNESMSNSHSHVFKIHLVHVAHHQHSMLNMGYHQSFPSLLVSHHKKSELSVFFIVV